MVGSTDQMSIPRLKQVTVFHEVVVDMINSGGFLNQRQHRVVIRHISLDRAILILPPPLK
jgi:hypothetical protein